MCPVYFRQIVRVRVVGGIVEWSNYIVWPAATSHLDKMASSCSSKANSRILEEAELGAERSKNTAPVRSEEAERTAYKNSPSSF